MLDPTQKLSRQLRFAALVILVIVMGGTLGYWLIEGWSLLDSLYMAIITLSTVGFTEVRPLSPLGRAFTIVLIVVGVGTAAYLLSTLADFIIAGELYGTLKRRRMQNTVNAFHDHFIVCGFGRVGRQVVSQLEAAGSPVVILEKNPALLADLDDERHIHLMGDASDDDLLRRAGIDRARGLVAATGADADNVFIVLSARAIAPGLPIVARGIMPDAEPKLRKAGANHVIMPHVIGGRQMAGMLLRPTVVDFLDVVMHSAELEFWLEDVRVAPGCELENLTVGEAAVRGRTGATILAIRSVVGQLITNVGSDYALHAGDVLVALGTRQQLKALADLACDG